MTGPTRIRAWLVAILAAAPPAAGLLIWFKKHPMWALSSRTITSTAGWLQSSC